MAQVTTKTEPRLSLLLAVFFTGVVLFIAAEKGHLPSWAGVAGNVLMIGSIVWQIARAWYLRR